MKSIDATPQMESWIWNSNVLKYAGASGDDAEYRAGLSWSEFNQLISAGRITEECWVRWDGLATAGIRLGEFLNSEYFYESVGTVLTIPSEDHLHIYLDDGRIFPNTKVWGRKFPARGIQVKDIFSLEIDFSPSLIEFSASRKECWLTVLSGANNSGKSLLLKLLHQEIGSRSLLLGCDRFYHFSDLPYASDGFDYAGHYRSSIQQLYQRGSNTEKTNFPLQQVISNLPDERRAKLFEICTEKFGEKFEVRPRREDTKMTKYYVTVGGLELSQCSTGTRLFLLLLGALMSSEHGTVLIDEPELGLSPHLQRELAGIIFDEDLREELFPSIQSLFIATHRHHFLARGQLDANFVVQKAGSKVSLKQVMDTSTYHDLLLRMLGDDLGAFFMPKAIILVEGPSDKVFFERIFAEEFPGVELSIVNCGGDGRIAVFFNQLLALLPNFHCSPYRSRTFIILDAVNSVKDGAFTRAGIPSSNVVRLDKNGIEFYYPINFLAQVFGVAEALEDSIILSEETVTIGDVTKKKVEVAQEIVLKMKGEIPINDELTRKVLGPIRSMLNVRVLPDKVD